jgi:hypothetical protein
MNNAVAAPPSTHLERPRLGGLSRLAGALVLAVALAGCATQGEYLSTGQAEHGDDAYKVGPITVMIRPQPDVELFCKVRGGAKVSTTVRIHGCYMPADKTIVSTPDYHVLLHEFKHHFEGAYHR